MNKAVFNKTLSGQRNLDLNNINFAQGGQIRFRGDFPTTEQIIVSDVATNANIYKTLTPSMVGLKDLTAGTNITIAPDGVYDGTAPQTISSTDTTYTAGNGIQISGGSNQIQTRTDNSTIRDSGGGGGNQLEVIKVPNALTAGTNITFSAGTTYDGSTAITINSTDTDTTYSAGTNLNLAGTTFNLNTTISGMVSVQFLNDGTTTSIQGSDYPQKETTCSSLNLLDSTNIISPYFLHDVYDPSSADADSLSSSYASMFSGNLNNSFVAKSTDCCIELLTYNYSISGNRWLYLRLTDASGTEWSVGTNQGGNGTRTRTTDRIIQYTDETDKVPVRQTWYLQGLTIGNTYTINPQARTDSTLNYIYAGGSYPASIIRGYYLTTTSSEPEPEPEGG